MRSETIINRVAGRYQAGKVTALGDTSASAHRNHAENGAKGETKRA